MNIFSYTSPSVKRLLGWKQGGEEEKWAEKAVESLVKKLKRNRGAIEDLENALANPGSPSNCVTISRSLDGRLQVSHRKGLPHVIYCKVWRWPDLSSQHELKALECCHYSYYSKLKEVCVNPYHYKRVEVTGSMGRYPDSEMCSVTPVPQINANELPLLALDLNHNIQNPSPIDLLSPSRSYSCISNDSASPGLNEAYRQSNAIVQNAIPRTLPDKQKTWCSVSYYELNSRVGETHYIRSPEVYICGYSDKRMMHTEEVVCLGSYSNINRNTTIENTRRSIGQGLKLSRIDHGNNNFVIKVKCESKYNIFVQSQCFNIQSGLENMTVCKVPRTCELEVFKFEVFRKYLNAINRDYRQLHEMTKMCSIRVSFVKGWGADYRRQDITSTPCWIEILFVDALKELDGILTHIETPSNKISSIT